MSSYRAVGELQLAGFRFAKLLAICRVLLYFKPLGNHTLQGFALCQAIGEFHFVVYCVASSDWGVVISRLLSCVKLLANYNLQGRASRQTMGELPFAGFCVASRYWEFHLAVFSFAPSCWGGSCLLSSWWGIRKRQVLVCTKLLGDYNLQGPVLPEFLGGLQLAGAIFFTREIISLISRLRFIIHLKHALRHVS